MKFPNCNPPSKPGALARCWTGLANRDLCCQDILHTESRNFKKGARKYKKALRITRYLAGNATTNHL